MEVKKSKSDATKVAKAKHVDKKADKVTVKAEPIVAVDEEFFIPKSNHLKVRYGVPAKILQKLTETYPTWKIVPGGDEPHSHPMGAVERLICEEQAYRDITRVHGKECSISDIGGSANRHAKAGRLNVHSCNPILSSSDAARRHPDNYHKDANYCQNTAQDCKHTPDVYLAVHSLYYLTPTEVLRLMMRANKRTLYAVVHRFDNLYGTFHNNGLYSESEYSLLCESELKVHMRVRGNMVGYTHDPCMWLARNYFVSGKEAMAWDGYPVGDSWIIKFVEAPIGLEANETKALPLIDSINRDDHTGPIEGMRSYGDSAKLSPMLEVLRIKTKKFVSLGRFTMVYGEKQRTILVPKSLIRECALKIVGLPRDTTTLQLCIRNVKSELKNLNMPGSMKLDCAIYGSSMAFVFALQDEIEAFNNLCQPKYIRAYQKLKNALSLTSLPCCGNMANVSEPDETTTSIVYNNDRSSVPGPSFDARKAWPFGLPGVECRLPFKKMKDGAKVDTSGVDPNEKEYGPQMQSNCITFSNYIPVVPTPSANNEERAVRNRAVVETPPEDSKLWGKVIMHGEMITKTMGVMEEAPHALFERWNAHHEPAKRALMNKAYASLQQHDLEHVDFLRKVHVKREVTMKGGVKFEDFDPRAITASSDRVNAAYGPFAWHASKELLKIWDKDFRVCWTSGMTGEEIGEWAKEHIMGQDVVIFELDESRYDAHQKCGVRKAFSNLSKRAGIAGYQQAHYALKQMFAKRGFTQRGIKYSVDGTMGSGQQDTSFSNTYVNGCKLDYIMRKAGFGVEEYAMLVNGDDSFLVVKKKLSNEECNLLSDCLVDKNRQLGFTTKCKFSRNIAEVEYCSSLFWPVEGTYVLGPKIGRRLPKIGFGLNKLTEGEIKGMLLGLRIEAGFVPVIRLYTSHCLQLLSKVKEVKYVDERSVYKSFARSEHKCDAETEMFFLERYGFTVKSVEDDLVYALKKSKVFSCVNFPLLSILIDRDV